MQRYFIESNDFILSNDQLHHIKNVMRMKEGDHFIIINDSIAYDCEITSLSPFYYLRTRLDIPSPELNVDITLLYCLPKGDKLDLVIQKATEIGVNKIVLVQSSRCVSKFKKEDFDKKRNRFKKIAVEASEQSHRLKVPEIYDIIDYKDIKKYHFDQAYIAYENEETIRFDEDFKNIKTGNSIGVLIGSEGGFSIEEVEYAKECGYKSISLGKRILRSETACIYALSVLANYVEEL